MEVITGSFEGFNNNRLLKSGITNECFKVLEDMKEKTFNSLKVGDTVSFIFNDKQYTGTVEYKYRDKKDIKVKLIV